VAASCDLVETGTLRKLAGCAQRRQNGVILQQASIPLTRTSDPQAIRAAIKAGMEQVLGVERWVSVDTVRPV
jgi:lipoate-protein ligase A